MLTFNSLGSTICFAEAAEKGLIVAWMDKHYMKTVVLAFNIGIPLPDLL
jgi:hypothetical protein